jgi:hypothetical protein
MEEEWVHDVNLNGGCVGGVDLDGGRAVETHAEEERGVDVEAVSAALRRMWRRSGRRWVCDGEMIGLEFRGSDTFKRKNSSDGRG